MVFLRLLPLLAHLPAGSLARCVCLLTVLLLTSCSSASTATGGLAPVTRPLAPPPQQCAIQPPPEVLHLDSLGANRNVHLVGGGPFWIYGGFYHSVLHLAQFGSQQWPMTKLVVEVGPNYDQPVTLRLRQMRTGVSAWWTDGQTPARRSRPNAGAEPPDEYDG